eukprot:7483816-Alexandrium_andersonii.AAC.1
MAFCYPSPTRASTGAHTVQVRGLIHLAAVLDDATMPKLTRGHLERAYGAKASLWLTSGA